MKEAAFAAFFHLEIKYMAFNGSGTFNRLYNWVTDRNNGVKIQASRMDGEIDGIATGLSLCLLKDGQQTPTANIPMGGYKLTNLGDATNATDALNRQTADARFLSINGIANGDYYLTLANSETLTATRTLTFGLHDADRTIDIAGDVTIPGDLTLVGAYDLSLTMTAGTSLTLPTTGTLATLAGTELLQNKSLAAPGIRSSGAGTFDLVVQNTEDLTAARALTIKVNDAARTIDLGGNLTLAGALATSGAYGLTLTLTGSTSITLPTSGTLAVIGADNAFSAAQSVVLSNTSDAITAKTTDASADDWAAVVINRASATPAPSDVIGSLVFRGKDGGASDTDYALLTATILDQNNGSEDARLTLYAMVAGTKTAIATYGPGVQFGAPTGGDQGAGTLNMAAGLYLNGSAIVSSVGAINALSTLTASALVDISGASAGQIKFPSTQNASSDANTLDDYYEFDWTPVVAFATPGNSSFSYSTQSGKGTKIGNRVFLNCTVVFTPTIGTGSGTLSISGFTGSAVSTSAGALSSLNSVFSWPSGRTMLVPAIASASSAVVIRGYGTGVGTSDIAASNMTSGSSHTIAFSISFQV